MFKQLYLSQDLKSSSKPFLVQKGRRKTKRPLSTERPIHLVIKSARSDLKAQERWILRAWQRFAKKFGIKTYQIVVHHNHIHVVIRLSKIWLFAPFFRAITGSMAKCFGIRFMERPVTRVANWGRDFKRLKLYLEQNEWESEGFLDYLPGRTRELWQIGLRV